MENIYRFISRNDSCFTWGSNNIYKRVEWLGCMAFCWIASSLFTILVEGVSRDA